MKKYSILLCVAVIIVSLLVLGSGCKAAEAVEEAVEETAEATEEAVEEEVIEEEAVEEEETTETEDKLVIGLSLTSMDESMRMILDVMTEEAEAAGVELVYTSAENKIDRQISDIESLITRQCDAILLRSQDPDGIVSAVDAAAAAGIPTMEFGGIGVSTDKLSAQVIITQTQGAKLTADYIIDLLEEDPELVLKVGYMWGWKGIPLVDERYYGIFNNLTEYMDAGRVVILDEQVTNFDINESMNLMEDWLQKFQDMNCIITMGDGSAVGAVNVLKAANANLDDWYIFGFGAIEAADYIREGTVIAAVFNDIPLASKAIFGYGLELAKGKVFTEPIDLSGLPGVWIMTDKNNIDEVLGN